jgi:FkbM family methyltransferase
MNQDFGASFHGSALHPIRWLLSYPARLYLRYSPILRGKGWLENLIVRACVPPELPIDIRLPCGDLISMTSSEKIGRYLLIYRKFELAELRYCARMLVPGTVAIDVGANVGIFSLTLSRGVTDSGGVIAIEPSPANFARLTSHININCRANIRALQVAAGKESGNARINVDVDPAFGAAVGSDVPDVRSGRMVSVEVRTLDDIWDEECRPKVGLIKIDVEGGEVDVILGANRLISTCRPVLLVEATTDIQLNEIRKLLAKYKYVGRNPSGFQPWNYVFSHQNETDWPIHS